MINDIQGQIRVNSKIKPLPIHERISPILEIGGSYFVSFGSNKAYPCKVIGIDEHLAFCQVKVEFSAKSKKLTLLEDNTKSYFYKFLYTFNLNQIGKTPEQAVQNQF